MSDSLIHGFVSTQKEVLDLELDSEKGQSNEEKEESSRQSKVVRNLEASDVSVGLYGRTVVRLTLSTSSTEGGGGKSERTGVPLLPAHRFTVGDDVEIHSKSQNNNNKRNTVGGVISAVSDTGISVALFQKKKGSDASEGDDEDIVGTPPLSLIPKSSVEVHRKLVRGLCELERHGFDHPIAGSVVKALFEASDPIREPRIESSAIKSFNPNLDESQLEAIAFALQPDRRVALCHGPPGTGKTTTVAELIKQAVRVHKMKVLVTAPSNVAVDNVLERLAEQPEVSSRKKSRSSRRNPKNASDAGPLNLVRLGHPARIKQSIVKYSLEALVQNADGTEIVTDVRNELHSFLRILSNPKSRGNDKRLAYKELKPLRKELREREENVVQQLISKADVVLATNVGAASRLLDRHMKDGFDIVIIDEAAQALEASCWIPVLRGRKLILAGDHCQLPPTIMSQLPNVQKILGKTMFQRIMDLYGDHRKHNLEDAENETVDTIGRVSRMLKVQYRMHEDIAGWASHVTYNDQLQTHESAKNRTLAQLIPSFSKEGIPNKDEINVDKNDVADQVLLLIDTAGCALYEAENASSSRYNQGEADLVAQHVQKILNLGIQQNQIAIITPYNGQVEILKNLLLEDYPKLEIRSVDGFQGGEREAVILSLVRSSVEEYSSGGKKSAGIGFLRDNRRLNVAVTRARRHLCVVCDSETVTQSKFISSLISWIEKHGEQRSALEFLSSDISFESDLHLATGMLKEAKMTVAPPFSKNNNTSKKEEEDALKRKGLLDRISAFVNNAEPDEEMTLSTDLTSYDRKLIHEFAEQLGIEHRSEGVEGINRRIVLKNRKVSCANPSAVVATATNSTEHESKIDTVEVAASANEPRKEASAFAALAMLDDDDDSSTSKDDDDVEISKCERNQLDDSKPSVSQQNESNVPTSNQVLGDLAKERARRMQEKKRAETNTNNNNSSSKNKSKKNNRKKDGQRLGGSAGGNKNNHKKKEEDDDALSGLDDMAFLDAQIEKVQNSHGRKVTGTGSNYRSIINGVLISKPPPREQKQNKQASAALQDKLKKAQNSRKAKGGKKKKK